MRKSEFERMVERQERELKEMREQYARIREKVTRTFDATQKALRRWLRMKESPPPDFARYWAQMFESAQSAALTAAAKLLKIDLAAADPKSVRAAYHRLTREVHPDRHPGATSDDAARLAVAEKMKHLADARDLLVRHTRRNAIKTC